MVVSFHITENDLVVLRKWRALVEEDLHRGISEPLEIELRGVAAFDKILAALSRTTEST